MTLKGPLERPKMSTGNPYMTLNFFKNEHWGPKKYQKMEKIQQVEQHNPLKYREIPIF